MTTRPPASRWATLGLLLAMGVVLVAPLRWVVRVDGWPTAIVVAVATAVAVVASGRLGEKRWAPRLALALLAGVVAERLGGGLAGVWVLVAVVLCDWAIRRRPPVPGVPASSNVSAVPAVALSVFAMWLAGRPGSAISVLTVLTAAVVATAVSATAVSAHVRRSPDRVVAALRSVVAALRSVVAAVIDEYRERSSFWNVATIGAVLWAAANVVWFEVHRGARLWDHEEVTYARLVSFFASGDGGDPWSGLFVAHYGPMQALLGAPFQWIFGVNEATVVYLNIGLTAVTGLLVFWMVGRLADPPAGLVAGALVLLTPGMLENARGALTMVPATTFAALAMGSLVAGRGLRRWQWAVVGGVALGCMSLSRPMSVAFIPGMAVPAVVWSLRSATPWRTVVRNGALAALAAVAVSAWWWVVRFPLVMDYLSTGSDGVATGDVSEVFHNRLYELSAYVGPIASSETLGYTWYVAAGAFVLLFLSGAAWRTATARITPGKVVAGAHQATSPEMRTPPETSSESVRVAQQDAPLAALPLWPLWAAVGVDLAVSLASNTIGWLMLPVVPWMIAATVAGVRRHLGSWAWRGWAVVVLLPVAVVALLTSTVSVTPGNRFTWCIEPWQKTSACMIEDRTQAAEWKADIRRITDDAVASQVALAEAGRHDARIAVVARDHIVLPSIIRFEAWVLRRRGLDDSTFIEDHVVIDGNFEQLRDQAGVVVVSPDIEEFRLFPRMIDPDELPSRLLANGFAVCHEVELPDGRVVQTFVREPLPASICD